MKAVVLLVLVATTAWGAANTIQLVVKDYENPGHGLVYVQTRNNTVDFLNQLKDFKTAHPGLKLLVSSKDSSWPLPFYLEPYHPDYFGTEQLNTALLKKYDAAVVQSSVLPQGLQSCRQETFTIRPNLDFVGLFPKDCNSPA